MLLLHMYSARGQGFGPALIDWRIYELKVVILGRYTYSTRVRHGQLTFAVDRGLRRPMTLSMYSNRQMAGSTNGE